MDRPPTESELKIPTQGLAGIRDTLRHAGARPLGPREREVNILFDDHQRSLWSGDTALRLRRVGGRWLLTYKGRTTYIGHVKQREELESQVTDGEALAAIFDRLGLHPAMRYEKDRELWALGEVEVALDHTPMGDFVELEGPVNQLAPAARSLGLDPADSLPGSYVSLWQQLRESHPERRLPEDMVFADE